MSPALAILAVLAVPLAPSVPSFTQVERGKDSVPAQSAQAQVRLGPWSVLGPFDNPKGADVSLDPGLEKHVKRMKADAPWPALEETFAGRGKAKLAWRCLRDDEVKRPVEAALFDTGTLDLRALLGATGPAGDNSAAYLYRTIEADAAFEVALACGSDDGLRLWLDGELLLDNGVARALSAYDENVTLQFVPGTNHLLVKVTNGGGPWSFAMLERRRVTKDEVNRAIDRGVGRLLELQLIDGAWAERRDDYPTGQTGLSLYTLLKCGLSPQHHAILQALACMRAEPAERTYSLACQLLAVAALHDPAQLEWMEELADGILAWQDGNGGWSYPGAQTDLSNTHLAAFSLRAAAQAGIAIPATVWNDLASFTIRHQESRRKSDASAGFVYTPGHETGYTGSMTTAGLAILALTREALGERMLPTVRVQVDPAIEAGLVWLGRHWSVTKNPNKPDWHLYYLYALERVGALLGLQQIGGHDWYAEGAEVLVRSQDAEGGWGGQAETCFALLFLRRATAQPVSEQTDDGRLFATAEGEGPFRLRVKCGTPSQLWIDAPVLAGALKVTQVDFFARRAGTDWRSVTTVERSLAARYRFDRPGSWEVRAEALLSDGSRLSSSTLTVLHEEGLDPKRLPYATDALKNHMGAMKPAVRCSSQLEPAVNAVDNRIWTRWLCNESDAEPWIELDPERPLEIARLLLTHARMTGAENRRANPRPARVELWINKEKAPRLVTVDPDPCAKTVLDFSPPIRVTRLKLCVVAVEGGTLGKAAVGFGEIEAQDAER